MIAKDQLKSIIERVERLNTEAEDIAEAKKEIFAEAKSNGFDCATLRAVIKLRAEEPEKRKAKESLLEIYLQALGQLPLFEVREAAE